MINIFIALSCAIFSFEMFSISSKISFLNKTMFNIPLSIFSYSVPLINQSTLHYDKNVLETKLDEYFNKNVTKLVGEYKTKYTYYSSKSGSVCMSSSCDTIKIELEANVDGFYTFHRAMKYLIGVNK